jgi:hypothetical protein
MPNKTFTDVVHFAKGYEDLLTFALDDRDREHAILRWDTFFLRLYIPAQPDEERELQAILDEAARMVVIVAPRGGGKTTFLMHGLEEYSGRGGMFFCFDFKANGDALEPLTRHWPRNLPHLHTILKDALYSQYIGDDIEAGNRFTEEALSMFFPRDKARFIRGLEGDADIRVPPDTLQTVFTKRPDLANQQEEFVFGHLSFGEMVQVVMEVKRIEKFVVCFDNVDRLAAEVQPYLLSLAIDVYHRGRGAFGTVVTLREKNVLRYTPDGADGDVLEVLTPTGQPEQAYKVDLHSPPERSVHTLLDARQVYAKDVFLRAACGDVDDEFVSVLGAARTFANSSFISQRLFNLANHSRRELLVLSAGFTRYLVRLVYEDRLEYADGAIRLSPVDCRSYLYRWIYAAMNPRHEWLRDPVVSFNKYEASPFGPASACDLEWVILAWLQRHQRKLHVGDVVSAFEMIGVDAMRTRASLFSLYDCEHPDQRHVELGDVESRLDPGAVTDGCLAYITPLGTEYIQVTVTKFEYLLQAIRFPDSVPADSDAMLRPLDHNSEEVVRTVCNQLRRIGRVHAAALAEFRSALAEKSGWEAFYRREFCVSGRLILERMVISHLLHLAEVGNDIAAYGERTYRELIADFYARAGIAADPDELFRQAGTPQSSAPGAKSVGGLPAHGLRRGPSRC